MDDGTLVPWGVPSVVVDAGQVYFSKERTIWAWDGSGEPRMFADTGFEGLETNLWLLPTEVLRGGDGVLKAFDRDSGESRVVSDGVGLDDALLVDRLGRRAFLVHDDAAVEAIDLVTGARGQVIPPGVVALTDGSGRERTGLNAIPTDNGFIFHDRDSHIRELAGTVVSDLGRATGLRLRTLGATDQKLIWLNSGEGPTIAARDGGDPELLTPEDPFLHRYEQALTDDNRVLLLTNSDVRLFSSGPPAMVSDVAVNRAGGLAYGSGRLVDSFKTATDGPCGLRVRSL